MKDKSSLEGASCEREQNFGQRNSYDYSEYTFVVIFFPFNQILSH